MMTAARGPSSTQRCGWTTYRNQHLYIQGAFKWHQPYRQPAQLHTITLT